MITLFYTTKYNRISNTESELELVTYDGQGPISDVLHITKRVVSQGPPKKHETENASSMLWIYDIDGIKEILLEEWFRMKLDDAQV